MIKKSVGFPISHKENENRRALLPCDIENMENKDCLFFEKDYGTVLGYNDEEYEKIGCHIASRDEILAKDIICEPKIGDAKYIYDLHGQTIFGWVHAGQNKEVMNCLIANKLTAYAWEDMFEDGRHTFWRNNEVAGEAAIMHAFECFGMMPYNAKVAVLGRGNVANGAKRILLLLGADVKSYDMKTEKLMIKELPEFDVVVNAILWDLTRTDHIICKNDLLRMKKNSLIIDVSCDRNGGIETSVPTTIENPTYMVDGIMHYVVDHTPSIFYKTVSKEISSEVCKFLDDIITGKDNKVLKNSLIVNCGLVVDNHN